MHKMPGLLRDGVRFITDLYEKRFLIYELTKRDFAQRYVGSYLGLFWAFLDPLAMVAILWFVFSVGLKTRVSGDAPFIAYLLTGMIAYNFVSDALGQSTGAIRAYAFLIQKANFRASILPIVKVNSALLLHLIFVILVFVLLIMTGIYPSFYWLQVLYYLPATLFFILGLSWLLSALGVFLKDMSHIVTILLRFWFWLTPIVWSMDIVPERFQPIFKLNPLFYIIQGYREALLYGVPFWAHPAYSLYFWSFSLITGALGVIVFLRLRPHFAEVI